MTRKYVFTLAALFTLGACSQPGEVGEECAEDAEDADCVEGLECHLHEHDGEIADHGECEEHDEDEEHEEHEA